MKTRELALVCLVFASVIACKKEELTTEPQPAEDKAAYNVIFIGNSGGNDQVTLEDFTTLVYNRECGRIGDNVKFHGWCKASKELQGKLSKNLQGLFYFDLGSKPCLNDEQKLALQKLASTFYAYRYKQNPNMSADSLAMAYSTIFSFMTTKNEADSQYDLNNAANISSLVKKGADKYKAANYELMLFGHGTGFQAGYETPVKGCVPDDNFTDNHEITLPNIISGVKLSGVKLQTVFTQCCLMGTLEDLAAFSEITEYAIASTEVTFSGYFPEWVAKLSEKGAGEENFKAASRSTIDYYADSCYYQQMDYSATSHGFHDLSVMPELLPVVKDIASWYAANYAKDTAFFNDVLMRTITVTEVEAIMEKPKLPAQKIYFGTMPKDSLTQMTWDSVYDYLISENRSNDVDQGYVFAYLLDKTLALKESCKAQDVDFATLKAKYDSYMSLLHRMSYIRCNKRNGTNCSKDYLEYVLASASVNIYALNERGFKSLQCDSPDGERAALWADWEAGRTSKVQAAVKKIVSGCYLATPADHRKAYSLSEVKANYGATAFDLATGWSKFLEKLTINPSAAINPDRVSVSGYVRKK